MKRLSEANEAEIVSDRKRQKVIEISESESDDGMIYLNDNSRSFPTII